MEGLSLLDTFSLLCGEKGDKIVTTGPLGISSMQPPQTTTLDLIQDETDKVLHCRSELAERQVSQTQQNQKTIRGVHKREFAPECSDLAPGRMRALAKGVPDSL